MTRLVYLSSPEMAVPPLEALVAAGFPVELVVTRADARRGRGSGTTPTPVKVAAERLGLRVSHDVDDVLTTSADLGVVVAFGRIIRPHVLAAVPMVNLHFSLLPRWRGAAPVERALLAGDTETGVCLMQVEEGLDTGGVYARRYVPIGADTTADELRRVLVAEGTDLLVEQLRRGLAEPEPQVGEVTYANKISKDELIIDWRQPPEVVHRLVRLGGATTSFRGASLKVLAADLVGSTPGDELVGDVVGGLRLVEVQPEGKRPMRFADFANGYRPAVGERLG